jgi:hypothetical protein
VKPSLIKTVGNAIAVPIGVAVIVTKLFAQLAKQA